jgi:hypothetical protein
MRKEEHKRRENGERKRKRKRKGSIESIRKIHVNMKKLTNKGCLENKIMTRREILTYSVSERRYKADYFSKEKKF